MTRIRPHGLLARSRAALAPLCWGALAASLFPACDNAACIFGTQGPDGCLNPGGVGGSGATASTFPAHGEWVQAGAPQIESMFPTGTANSTTPIVIVFSESISPASISGAFELESTSGIGGGATPLNGSLVGDGRVLVLFPPPLVGETEYEVKWAEGSSIRDLTGSLSLRAGDGVVGSFSVAAEPELEPQLLMTWPINGSLGQSPISEVVSVFDRPLDPTSVTSTSWSVLVNGIAPTPNPAPAALQISAGGFGGGGATQDTRIWTWRSVDTATDAPVTLGTGASVTLELSPSTGTAIMDTDGGALVESSSSFTTESFAPPTGATMLSDPTDAIGVENLSGVMPLMIQVDLLAPAAEGDILEIWEFGTLLGSTGIDPDDPDGPPLTGSITSLVRTFTLDAGTASVVLNNAELDLVSSTSPLAPRFEDGDLGLAFALTRSGITTPVRVLDVDLDSDGIQDPRLDTVAPTFSGLSGLLVGDNDYRTDVRDLVVVGSADEDLASCEVIATLLGGTVDNRIGGALAPLAASLPSGEFIAAPLFLDTLAASELPLNFSIIVYDRALNPSQPFSARWTQLGSTGPATALPGSGLDVTVTVYDSLSLAPISGATVYSHEVVAGALTAFAPQSAITDVGGRATIASAPTGETIITVEALGHDLFSFHDVPTTKLDVPLVREGVGAAVVQPTAFSSGEQLNSAFLSTWIADSRVLLPDDTLHPGTNCDYNPLTDQTVCGFAPAVINAGRMGVLSFLATKEPASQTDPNAFSAASFLQAFEISLPRPRIEAGGLDSLPIQVGPFLSGADVDPDDVPLGVPSHALEKTSDFGIAFDNLVGAPIVSVEVLVHGLPGSMTVGLGKSYENLLNNNWDLRAAYSSQARSMGGFVESGLIRNQRYLRAEFVDLSGGRSGNRVPFTTNSGSLTPLPQPFVIAPSASISGTSYAIDYGNVIRGPIDTQGIMRLSLSDGVGRTWQIWQPDVAGVGATARAFLPPIELAGGSPLADGPVTCVVQGWAWPGFDAANFMPTDPEREHDHFVTTAPTIWTQQP